MPKNPRSKFYCRIRAWRSPHVNMRPRTSNAHSSCLSLQIFNIVSVMRSVFAEWTASFLFGCFLSYVADFAHRKHVFLQSIPERVCSPKLERKNFFFSGIPLVSQLTLCCSADMYRYVLRQCSWTLTTTGSLNKYSFSDTSCLVTLLSASRFLPSFTWTNLVSPSILTGLRQITQASSLNWAGWNAILPSSIGLSK